MDVELDYDDLTILLTLKVSHLGYTKEQIKEINVAINEAIKEIVTE
jgi:hypothetical protein